jgi:valyl-tRNA synthetase
MVLVLTPPSCCCWTAGNVNFCTAASGWVEPSATNGGESSTASASGTANAPVNADKEVNPGKSTNGAGSAAVSADKEIDPEKLAKKLAKQAEKEAKKAKALARTAAPKEPPPAASSKKAAAKAEAERKKAAEGAEAEAWLQAVRSTVKGEKKAVVGEMPKGYQPKAVEAAWCVSCASVCVEGRGRPCMCWVHT